MFKLGQFILQSYLDFIFIDCTLSAWAWLFFTTVCWFLPFGWGGAVKVWLSRRCLHLRTLLGTTEDTKKILILKFRAHIWTEKILIRDVPTCSETWRLTQLESQWQHQSCSQHFAGSLIGILDREMELKWIMSLLSLAKLITTLPLQ